MKKTIWHDTREQLKFIKQMTTFHNILVNVLFWAILIVCALFLVGLTVFTFNGYQYVASLYEQAGPDGKLGMLGGLIGAVLGSVVTITISSVVKRINKK